MRILGLLVLMTLAAATAVSAGGCGGAPMGEELARLNYDGESYVLVEYGDKLAVFDSDGAPVNGRDEASQVLHSYAWTQELGRTGRGELSRVAARVQDIDSNISGVRAAANATVGIFERLEELEANIPLLGTASAWDVVAEIYPGLSGARSSVRSLSQSLNDFGNDARTLATAAGQLDNAQVSSGMNGMEMDQLAKNGASAARGLAETVASVENSVSETRGQVSNLVGALRDATDTPLIGGAIGELASTAARFESQLDGLESDLGALRGELMEAASAFEGILSDVTENHEKLVDRWLQEPHDSQWPPLDQERRPTGIAPPEQDQSEGASGAVPPERTRETRSASPKTDREILVDLFHSTGGQNWSTGGQNWRNNENWLSDTPLQDWAGVEEFEEDGQVYVVLDLGDNQLTGEIPPELGNLTSFQVLNLSDNQLTGEIPPELGNLTSLQALFLSGIRLTGEIPPELGNLTVLGVLSLAYNRLRGEVPSWLGTMPLEFLMLSGNFLDGCAPASVIDKLGPDDDHDLQLNGHYCFAGPPQSAGQTFTADASTSAATDRRTLVSLYHAANGRLWSNSLNWLSDAPLDQWYGVYTNKDGRVVALHLIGGLDGRIPPELGDLSFLEELALPYNELWGEIPSELGDLPRLRHLNLYDNSIGGEIPPELGRLENLVSLHLGYNRLEGVIPRELGDLDSLEVLTLQGNNLSGGVPPELGASPSLRHLSLGSGITGCIPNRLYQQLNLETSRLGKISPC